MEEKKSANSKTKKGGKCKWFHILSMNRKKSYNYSSIPIHIANFVYLVNIFFGSELEKKTL